MRSRIATSGARLALILLPLGLPSALLRAQAGQGPALDNGKAVYEAACASCHGADGRGAPRPTVGFDTPLPDFTDCAFATREPDDDWSAIIHNGGPARGFSEIMPAYRGALSDEQIDQVIDYTRDFCRDPAWPPGNLNMPRALFTEKAFPEDEIVIAGGVTARGTPARDTALVLEKRVGATGQIEAKIPYQATHASGAWASGFGDVSLGYKQQVFHSAKRGSILSVTGEFITPTGDTSKGTGGETAVVETFAMYGQLLPAGGFLQFQSGVELPVHRDVAPNAWFGRVAVGSSFSTGGGLGRTWSPMMEVMADRALERGAMTNWDLVPQVQIPLSKRMHILGSIGVRVPANNTAERPTRVIGYLLWDFADGTLRQGW